MGLDPPRRPVAPLGVIRLGVLLPHLAVFRPPLEAVMALAVEEIAGPAQLVDPVGVPPLVTDLIELLNLLPIATRIVTHKLYAFLQLELLCKHYCISIPIPDIATNACILHSVMESFNLIRIVFYFAPL